MQLQAAAEACEAAAHYAALAPPKARAWAIRLVGDGAGTSTAPPDDRAAPNRSEPVRLSSSNPDDRPTLNNPQTNTTLLVDDRFTYHTDDLGRVVKASATLHTIDREHPRDHYAQRVLAGKLPGDHAGHIFARLFQGPGGMLNLTPMQGNKVNLGAFASLEREWRRHVADGHEVNVEIELSYRDNSRRPRYFSVIYRVGDKEFVRDIRNTPAKHNEG
ncbi:MAG: hypothetical protein GEU96_09250 [Propionibacteriales bacterium]|nr:hypothetical protein [Propionibacteriales bacterium]